MTIINVTDETGLNNIDITESNNIQVEVTNWVQSTLALTTLSDVDTTGVSNGQTLAYVSSTSTWENSAAGAGDMLKAEYDIGDAGVVDNSAALGGSSLSEVLAAGGGGAVDSVNTKTGVVVLDTSDISEVTNLYYTEARVSANTNVSANTTHITSDGTDHANVVLNDTHRGVTSGNPHSVSASDLTLGNVSNVSTDDTAYNATSWNTNTDAATKNAIRDKVETMDTAIGLNTSKSTNVSTTLSVGTVGINTVAITSDGGSDDVTLPAATISAAGMFTTAKWGEVVANTAKVTNAIHTGEVTGSSALTAANTLISNRSLVTAVGADHVMIIDATDGNLKKALISDFASAGGDMSVTTYDPATVSEQLVGLTATQTVTNKTLTSPVINNPIGIDTSDVTEVTDKNYVTDAEAIIIGNTSGTNTGDESTGNLTEATSSVLTITSGTNAVVGSGTTIEVDQADTNNNGYLSSADWNTFNDKVTNATHTGDVTGATGLTISVSAVDIAMLSATGTPGSGNFLRGDNTWSTPSGSGDVSKVGTPINDQVGVWTGDGTLEGDVDLTFDGVNLSVGGNIIVGGTVDGIDIATDVAANTAKNTNVSTSLSLGTKTATTMAITSDGGVDDVALIEADTTNAGLLGADKWDEIVANTLKNTNVNTNITVVEAPTNVEIQSSDGTNDTIAAADVTNAGVMTTTMYDNHILNNAKNTNVSTDLSEGTSTETTVDVNSSDGTNATLVSASTSRAGLLTKAKWDEVVANTSKVTNATHTGEVTGATALTIADNIIDEANLKLDAGATNDYVLTADSATSGGMKWAAVGAASLVLNDLNDVVITSVADDEILSYDVASGDWINKTPAEAGFQTATFTSLADNDLLSYDLSSSDWVNASVATVKNDLSLNNVENTALTTWTGANTIVTVGTIGTGTWEGTVIADGFISSASTWNAKQSALTFGIANTNAVDMDSADAASGEIARFTVNGLESRSDAEMKTQLGYLTDTVDDTTPQLGGNLDIQAFNVETAVAADFVKLAALTATAVELNYTDGVTSAIQTQMDTKSPIADPTFTGEIGIGSVNVSETELGILEGATLTTAELNYVDGVTSAIQTQLDTKGVMNDLVDDISPTLGGDLVAADNNITGVGSIGFTQELDNGSKTASFSVDFGTDQKQKVTLTANTLTLTLDTTFDRVGNYLLKIVNGGLATLTWASESGSVYWSGGTAPTLTASGTDILTFYYDGTSWYGVATLDFS